MAQPLAVLLAVVSLLCAVYQLEGLDLPCGHLVAGLQLRCLLYYRDKQREGRDVSDKSLIKRDSMPRSCIDGETFFDGCNTCRCIKGRAACTRKACIPAGLTTSDTQRVKRGYFTTVRDASHGRQQTCRPGSSWKINCNTCYCKYDGTVAYCTERSCKPPGLSGDQPSGIAYRSGTPTALTKDFEATQGGIDIRRR